MPKNLIIKAIVNDEKEKSNPKKEFIRLKVIEDLNLKNYAITDNTFDNEGEVSNTFRHFYNFPNLPVKKNHFVRLYSGEGECKSVTNINKEVVHYFYWGSKKCIWNNGGDKATVLKIGDSFESKLTKN